MKKQRAFYFSLLLTFFVAFSSVSQNHKKHNEKAFVLNSQLDKTGESSTALKRWQEMKFGMFIHWGVYSIPAGVWKGKEIEKLGEQIMRHADIPLAEYEEIAQQFNPINFNAEATVKLAKQTGMKYIVLTAKHHDGFAMFDSKVTDYDIVDFTPYKKDILRELAEACKKYEMKLGLYYSTPDWHFNGEKQERNPDDGKLSVFGKVSKANEEYQVAQLKELMSNYGEIVELFFDMGEPTETQSKRFAETIRELQPNCVINGRIMNNQGDFITMPDNHLPDTPVDGLAWETPGTFYHTWGYKSWVKGKPLEEQVKEQIRKLSRITSMGGNYLLNIGPKSDGSVVPYEKDVLKGIGSWVAINEPALFHTESNPFKKLDWGYSTVNKKEGKLFLHVFDWPKNGILKIPGLKNKILKAYYLKDGPERPLEITKNAKNKFIHVAPEPVDKNLTIIALEYEGALNIEHTVINAKDNQFVLKDQDATKHGKYGMVSYRSLLKDDHRTWDIEVPQNGTYSVEIVYKLKYDQKKFKLEVDNQVLPFTLSGNSKTKSEKMVSIDGNETSEEDSKRFKVKGNWNSVTVGKVHLKKGKQTVYLKSGTPYIFVATLDEFRKKDRKYRGLNVDVKSITLKKE